MVFDSTKIPNSFFSIPQIGYKFGKSSFLILNAVFYKYSLNSKYHENLQLIISDILLHIEENKLGPRVFEELTDFCRVLFFLNENELIEFKDFQSVIQNISKQIQNQFSYYLKVGKDFHFCRGILVFGNYYLEAPKELNSFFKEISQIVDWLERHALSENEGLYWINENPNFQQKIYLSSIYGSLSVCKFLNKASNRGIKKAELVLQKALVFVMRQIRSKEQGLKIFLDPEPTLRESDKPMLQWVGGSFNILYSLVIDFKRLLKKADYNFILKNLELIANMEEDMVDCKKTSIGYGSMGVSLMFEKLYCLTKNDKFKKASIYWYNLTLKRVETKESQFSQYSDLLQLTGFISGYSGVYTGLKLFQEKETHLIEKLIYI